MFKKFLFLFILFSIGVFKIFPWSKYTHIALTIKSNGGIL